ncbi:MAG: hypothetical protein NTZ69_14765 [Bacteroidia bacterium]|nr:hypothetical protein [Bacteroidia bacterium]
MKYKIEIELFEEHHSVTFYTLRFQDEATEVDKFLDQFPEGCEYDEDIDIIIKWIEQIGERGALERYFRTEGKIVDRVCAIPIETASLRLYVIRLTENIVILGNGGIKNSVTYNEDPVLSACVMLLQEVDYHIRTRINKGQISIYQKKLFGNLTFQLKIDL